MDAIWHGRDLVLKSSMMGDDILERTMFKNKAKEKKYFLLFF